MLRTIRRVGVLVSCLGTLAGYAEARQLASNLTVVAAKGGEALQVTAVYDSGAVSASLQSPGKTLMDGMQWTVEGGMPLVPVQTARLALPAGRTLDHIVVKTGDEVLLKSTITRAGSMVPLSWERSMHSVAKGVQPLFSAFPEQPANVSIQWLHGQAIAIVTLYPAQALPGEKVRLTNAITVEIETKESAEPQLGRGLLSHEMKALSAAVDNPDMLSDRSTVSTLANGYDYLIISSQPMMAFAGPNGLADFKAHLESRGLHVQIVDVATIDSTGTGADRAAKIRNYVRDQYRANGIRYLLLAGDGDKTGAGAVIPARPFWSRVNAYTGTWQWVEENIPADLYYSNLDGEFDGNGNGKWGEPTDGANGGDVDLMSELSVGRWPVKTTADLANVVRKTIWMAHTIQPKNVLLMGEELFAELNLYGDDYMNQLVGQCTDHGFQTTGYGQDWAQDHLYDRTGSWSGSQALSKINGGTFSMVNHLGHSNTTYNMRMSSSSISGFRNVNPFFYYTQGCFPGDFTANDCYIEKLLRHTNGAAAAIANTSYGLGPEDPTPSTTTTPGASQMLHRQFINAVFNQRVDSLSRANSDSKEDFIGLANAQEVRWVMWDANFFGDPSLRLQFE